jgi:IclR family KDG regulon transcriptional repressor
VKHGGDPEVARPDGSPGGPLRRAFAILDVLAEAGRPLTLSELAHAAKLPKSTAHRLMRVLVQLGPAARVAPRHYELSDYLSWLATARGPVNVHHLSCTITPFLLELHRLTRQVVSVAILTGSQVDHAGILHDRDHARLAMALRAPMPAHCSAAGKLLLATGPRPQPEPDEGRRVAYTSSTIVRSDTMKRELAKIRRTGLSYARGEYLPELVEVAAPVCLGHDGPVAAVVVGGLADRMNLRAAGRILQDVLGSVEEYAESVPNRLPAGAWGPEIVASQANP